MLKIVIFDSGYGGEFFADRLEQELPVVEVIRVIDWRHASELGSGSKTAKKIIKDNLRPYIGKVDLIFFANYLISATSLKYFKRKYQNQKFLGLKLELPAGQRKQSMLILTTKPVTKTINYYNYLFRLGHHRIKTISLDSWPLKIDNGELTEDEIRKTILPQLKDTPRGVIIACAQFYDIRPELKKIFGHSTSVYDNFSGPIRDICKILKIRGGLKKIK